MSNNTFNEAPPAQMLAQMISGYWISQAIYVVAKFGIADQLKMKAQTADELAKKVSIHSDAVYRLLRALASVGIFKEDDKKFSLTPLAELLCQDHPQSQKAFAIMLGGAIYGAWGNLDYSVKTGQQSFANTFDQPLFEYLTKNPSEGKIFDEAMTGIHGGETQPMIEAYDFSQFQTVVDIGGGNGMTLIAVLKQYPHLQGILFDLPEVIKRAEAIVKTSGTKQCTLTGGDFFKAVSSGGDAYILRHIIHDWPDDQAITILKNCRLAMKKGAKVLIVENVLPTDNRPHFGKWLDLMMLVIGGKERTEEQYRQLLEQAGLKINRVIPTSVEISIVEAVAE